MKLISLGSDYGGWIVPDIFNEHSVCYFAGAGKDITFDIEFIKKYQCAVNIFDPTPRAISHVNSILSGADIAPIPPDSNFLSYKTSSQTRSKIQFFPLGLSNTNGDLVFYSPQNNDHVSHSLTNLQKTKKKDSIMATCKTLSTIMSELGHEHIDILKLDIEGAEEAVLDDIFKKILVLT